MKKHLYLFGSLIALLATSAFASQSVDMTVSFDNYTSPAENDLLTNFTVSDSAFAQIQSGGITGGSLAPKTSASWGNTKATYRYTFCATVGAVFTSSVDFFIDNALVNPNQKQRPVGIFLNPSADWNHYILAYVEPPYLYSTSRTLQIVTNSWAASNSGAAAELSLPNGWYRLKLNTTIIGGQFGDQISVRAEVYSLGLTGTSTPLSVGVTEGTIYDEVFARDSRVAVSVHGTQWGGSKYLDNFRFTGPTNDDTTTGPRRFGATIANAVKVAWPSIPGKSYTVEWSPDMQATSWRVLSSGMPGTGFEMSVFDTIEGHGKRFYRVKEQ